MSATQQTKQWVDEVVVGLNFCPFARREVVNNRVRYVETTPSSLQSLNALVLDEYQHLNDHPDTETTLILLIDTCDVFDEFLFIVDEVNRLTKNEGYEGVYQIAHFHPNYQFEGDAPEAASNYTNRAPYPTLHIIREASLQRVLNERENSDDIVERNIKKAEQLGSAFFKETLQRITRA